MKPHMIMFLIFTSAVCYAQKVKDSSAVINKEKQDGLRSAVEKRDTSQLKRMQFLLINKILFYKINDNYMDEVPKSLLKEELEKIKLTPLQQAEANLKESVKYIKMEIADKRSGFQKFLEDLLGIAKYAAAIFFAVKTLVK